MNFPSSTQFNKKLPKQSFYENLTVSATIKKLFVEQINALYWQNKLSADTINLTVGETVTEIEVFRIILNQDKIDEAVLKLMDKGIPYHIVFILEFNEKIMLCTAYKEVSSTGVCSFVSDYYYTEWADEESVELNISGLSLDSAYEGFVRQIAKDNIVVKSDDIKRDIETSRKIEKLKKEIAKQEKQAKTEKQPKKKFDIVQRIKSLKNELSATTKILGTCISSSENVAPKNDAPVKEKPMNTVKALSILPEYADDILVGMKTVEWRSWKTDYRGDLLICASSRKLKGYISGYALCMVKLVDVVPFTRKYVNKALMDGVPDPAGYAWILEDVRYIEPFKYKGQLHIYDVDASLVKVLAPIDTKEGDEVYEKLYKPLYNEVGAEL